MTESKVDKKFEQVAQKIDPGSTLLRAQMLKGGVSAQVTALDVQQLSGQTKKVVVRQHGARDLQQNPHVAEDEFKLLQILQAVGLPVPLPLYLDQSSEIFATPYIVVEYIEGKAEFAPSDLADFILQSAVLLSRIHSVDCSLVDLSFLPAQEKVYAAKFRERPPTIDESLDEGRIRDNLEAVWPLPARNKPALLHGDFWPGNILWKDGRLVAVIDWEDAQLGDPLADLANSRLEILWAFGAEAMHNFTYHYRSMTPIDYTNLAYWDLCAALRHALRSAEWATYEAGEKTMRDGYTLFVRQAFENLPVQGYKLNVGN